MGRAGPVSQLAEPKGLSRQAAQAVGYAEVIEHLGGELTLAEATEKIKVNTRRLAKRQRTWFRGFEGVRWFDVGADESAEEVAERIAESVNP